MPRSSPKDRLGTSDPLARTYSVPMLRLNCTSGDFTIAVGEIGSVPWSSPAVYDTNSLWDQGNPTVIDFKDAPTMSYWLSWSINAQFGGGTVGYVWLDNDPAQVVDLWITSGLWTQSNFIFKIENGQTLRITVDATAGGATDVQAGATDRLYLSVHGIPGTESRS